MALRILIVEDDPHTRTILESLLREDSVLASRGIEVITAADGQQGLLVIDRDLFDLVISDLYMPRMDGFALCRALRRHPHGASVPIIVTSGVLKDTAALNALRDETGAQFFAKPFQLRDLLSTVRGLVGVDKSARGDAEKDRDKIAEGFAGDTPSQAASRATLGRLQLRKSSTLSLTSGALEDRGAAALMLELSAAQATGTLHLTRGQLKKQIHFAHGMPLAAQSNVRQETLGQFLLARGLLDEAQHAEAVQTAHQRKDRIGHVLLERGWITEDELLKQLSAQFRARVVSVLRWRDGKWSFQIADPPADLLHTPVDGPQIVLAGLGRSAQPDRVAHAFADSRGTLLLSTRGERHLETIGRVFGREVTQLFCDRPRIEQVITVRELLPALDALMIAGLLDLEPADVMLTPPKMALTSSVAPGAKTLYEQLFGDEISEVYAVPGKKPPAPPAAEFNAGDDTRRRKILAKFLALQGKDAYGVLGVAVDASAADIEAAYQAQAEQFSFDSFAGVDLGRDYTKLESVQQMLRAARDTLNSAERRATLDSELGRHDAENNLMLEADLAATEAAQLIAQREYDRALLAARRAVARAPDQADYHAVLAWVTYLVDAAGDRKRALAAASPHLERAFAIDADNVETNFRAAQLALATIDFNSTHAEAAMRHLDVVLERAPLHQAGLGGADVVDDALAHYTKVCELSQTWPRLVDAYHRLLHRRAGDPARSVKLWLALADVHRHHLADPKAALAAVEQARSLAPLDPAVRAAEEGLRPPPPRADDLRIAWNTAPDDAAIGQQLFTLHCDNQAWDAACCVAQALTARGQASAASDELVRRFRPRFLQRATGSLSKVAESIRHRDEYRDLNELFGHLLRGRLRPAPGDENMAEADIPETFRRVLEYLGQVFELPQLPTVVRRADLADAVQAAPGLVVVGPGALAEKDRIVIAFRLGRALTWLAEGRAASAAAGTRRLRTLLYAAMVCARPDLTINDADGEIAKERSRLESDDGLRTRLTPIIERVLAAQESQISLSRHLRGLRRTANRVGLLLSGGALDVALTALDAEPEMQTAGVPSARDALIDFSCSPEYLAARDVLGLSVAV